MAKECVVVCNTKNGYCMQPRQCRSIAEGIRYAKSMGMAYRIFIDGKLFRMGSYEGRD